MIPLTVVCIALIVLVLWERRQNAEREKAWTLERTGLITRIQHPEFIVSTPAAPAVPDSELLREETDEIDRVGEIVSNHNGD